MTAQRSATDLLIDAKALLEHWSEGRALNWDGSTKGQARALIREIDGYLAEPNRALSFAPKRREKPCHDCFDGYCTMNCGPSAKVDNA